MKKYSAVGNMLLMRPAIEIKLELDESSGLGMKGGILIPEGAKVDLQRGESPIKEFRVISAGPDCKVAKPKDIVLANGLIVMKSPTADDPSLVMIAETSIVAVVEDVPDEVAPPAETVG